MNLACYSALEIVGVIIIVIPAHQVLPGRTAKSETTLAELVLYSFCSVSLDVCVPSMLQECLSSYLVTYLLNHTTILRHYVV